MSTVLYSPHADHTVSSLADIFLSAATRLLNPMPGKSKLPTHYTNFIGEELVSGESLWLPYIATDVDNGWVSFGVALEGYDVANSPALVGNCHDTLVHFINNTRCLKIYEPQYTRWFERLLDDYVTGCMHNFDATRRTICYVANALYTYESGLGDPFAPGKYNSTTSAAVRYLPRPAVPEPVDNSRNTYDTIGTQELLEALL